MIDLFINSAYALGGGGGEGAPPGPGGMFASFFPFFLIILIMYFLIIRPQIRRQREQKSMLEDLQKGDRVVTTGGIHGTIVGFKERDGIVILKVADNVKFELSKGAVTRKVKTGESRSENEAPVKANG